jgi:hypothetical protein
MSLPKLSAFLPSRKFVILIVACIVVVVVFLVGTSYVGSHADYNKKKNALVSADGTVSDAVTRDSNKNGIPDWEEALYGLDPKGDGAANKQIINQKKLAANIPTEMSSDSSNLSQTDKFSQELLSTILALRQSGGLTPEAVTNLAASLGDSVDAQHANASTYALSSMKITSDTASAKQAYKDKLKKVIDGYADVDLGSELSIIAEGLSGGGSGTLNQLDPLAEAYTTLGA